MLILENIDINHILIEKISITEFKHVEALARHTIFSVIENKAVKGDEIAEDVAAPVPSPALIVINDNAGKNAQYDLSSDDAADIIIAETPQTVSN